MRDRLAGRWIMALGSALALCTCKALAPDGSEVTLALAADSILVDGDTTSGFIAIQDVGGQLLDGDVEVLVRSRLFQICLVKPRNDCDPAADGTPIISFDTDNGQAHIRIASGERQGTDTLVVVSGAAKGTAVLKVVGP